MMDGLILIKKHLLRHFVETLDNGGCGKTVVKSIESSIMTHRLLSGIEETEVDAWIRSVHQIMQDHPVSWSNLLGVTACCSEPSMLLSHVQAWMTLLLDALKTDSSSESFQEMRIKCFRSLSQIFTRLQGMVELSGLRRDMSPFASRSIHVALESLKLPSTSTDLALAALELIHSVMTILPVSVRSQMETLVAVLCQIMAGNGSNHFLGASVQECSALCLALTPRASPGPSEAWSTMFKKALLSLADATDTVFMGMDDQNLASRARTGLDPPTSSLLGNVPGINNSTMPLRHLQPALDTLAAVLTLVEQLMSAPCPGPAPLPGSSLISALVRLLKLDEGSIIASGRAPPSSSMFTELCRAMPSIRSCAWRLIGLLIGLCGPCLCPLHPSLGRLMTDALRRLKARGAGALSVVGAQERQSLYQALIDLVHAGGVSAGKQLASEALSVAMIELYGSLPSERVEGKTMVEDRVTKKAKLSVSESASLSHNGLKTKNTAVTHLDSEISVQSAMLSLLEALLKSFGPLMQASMRSHFDSLSIHMASCISDAATASIRDPAGLLSENHATALDKLRIISYQLLFASLTVPAGHRPPYLSQALALFKLGRINGSPTLRAWCTSAIQGMECLMHPRAISITSVQQYAGLQEVAALPKPRMWCILDRTPEETRLGPLPQPIQVPSIIAQCTAPLTANNAKVPSKDVSDSSVLQQHITSSSVAKERKPKTKALKSQNNQELGVGVPTQQTRVSSRVLPDAGIIKIATSGESSDSEGSLPDIDSGDE